MSALVLIGTVASNGVVSDKLAASAELTARLKDDSLTPEGVEKILQDYEDKEVKVGDHTVGQLAEICELSLSKCSYNEFYRAIHLGNVYQYEKKNIINLFEYSKYCVDQKLKNYCLENIDEVEQLLMASLSEKDKKLIRSLLDHLPDVKMNMNLKLAKAFFDLWDSVGYKSSSKNEKDFLDEVGKVFSSISKISSFFSFFLKIPPGSRAQPKTDDILKIEWNDLEAIALSFKFTVYHSIQQKNVTRNTFKNWFNWINKIW